MHFESALYWVKSSEAEWNSENLLFTPPTLLPQMIWPGSRAPLICQLCRVNCIFIFSDTLGRSERSESPRSSSSPLCWSRAPVIGPYPVVMYATRKLEAALMAPIIFPLDALWYVSAYKFTHTAMTSCGNLFPSAWTLSSNMRTWLSSLGEGGQEEEEERWRKTTHININSHGISFL